jgi:glutathione synthetase
MMKLGIAISRTHGMDETWTTIQLAYAALQDGVAVAFMEPHDFEIASSGRFTARAHYFDPKHHNVPKTPMELAQALSTRHCTRRLISVTDLECLLLRAAPLNPTLLTCALFAMERGVRVINDPMGILKLRHKGWLALTGIANTPRTLVTHSPSAAQLFFESLEHGAVVKPAASSGGNGVVRVHTHRISDLEDAFRRALTFGDPYVVIQEYLPEARFGEKRLVWCDGELIGGYLRSQNGSEFRHNLKLGALPTSIEISPVDHSNMGELSPFLLHSGIRFAGIDMIGEYITDVNILNPGGVFYADRLNGTQLAQTIIRTFLQSSHPNFQRQGA